MNKKGAIVNFLAGLMIIAIIIILLAVMNYVISQAVKETEAELNTGMMVLETMQSSRNFLHMTYEDELMFDIVLKYANNDDCEGFRELMENYLFSIGETPTDWFIRYQSKEGVCSFPPIGFSDLFDLVSFIYVTAPPIVLPNPKGNDVLFFAKKLQVRDADLG